MKFKAHETFFIRKGWLYKGMKNVNAKADVFTDNKTQNPMDTLGIGANMVKSLRYWVQAVGLTEETKSGTRTQAFSQLGNIIWNNDKYLEEMGTLWLLHYKLATNEENATAWYYFFNKFRLSEFNKEDFVLSASSLVKMDYGIDVVSNPKEEEGMGRSSIEGDFDCIINTYVSRLKSKPEKVQPENNIDCPFGELGLIDIVNKKDKTYKKCAPKRDTLHPLVLLAVILDNADKDGRENRQEEIRITALQNDIGNIGKIFNLDSIALTDYLYKIAAPGYIKVVRTAGLDVIKIETEMDFYDCVERYYEQLNQ
jgi:hypothetical protein